MYYNTAHIYFLESTPFLKTFAQAFKGTVVIKTKIYSDYVKKRAKFSTFAEKSQDYIFLYSAQYNTARFCIFYTTISHSGSETLVIWELEKRR